MRRAELMDLELAGRRAIVTGGSKGIGRVIAEVLATEGVEVVIGARTKETLRAAAVEITAKTGTRVQGVVVDTRSDNSVAAMVDQAVERLGGVDILVNNAATPGGSSPVRAAAEVSIGAVAEDFNAKALAYLRTSQKVLPHLVEQGWGRIINIGGHTSMKTGFLSGALRNVAVTTLAKTLADEVGPHGVTVTTVHPAATRTERTSELNMAFPDITGRAVEESSNGRITEAIEVAWVVAFLASPKSVAINGESIFVGGGFRGRISYP
jgi:NAD(P)-dependent dehydrogenase (short-subunit alcohol dehydrogenase family)